MKKTINPLIYDLRDSDLIGFKLVSVFLENWHKLHYHLPPEFDISTLIRKLNKKFSVSEVFIYRCGCGAVSGSIR